MLARYQGVQVEQYKQIAYTLLRVFFGTLIAFIISNGIGLLDMQAWSDWKPALTAAISAVLVVIINALNPGDTRYGVNAGK
jgi:hypothetical protein